MLQKYLRRTLYILAFAVMIFNTVFSLVKSLTPDINDLPEGSLLTSFASPSGNARVDVYVVNCSLGSAVRGDYVHGDSHRNIYWQTGADTAKVEWLSEKSILIDNIPLNVKTDKFDSRRGTAIFSEGILAENINDND